MSFKDEAARFVALGLMTPEMAAKESTRALKNAQARYKMLMRQPSYREMVAKAEEAGFQSTYVPENVQHKIIQPEDIADQVLVPYRSDRTDMGTLRDYLGTTLNMPVQSGTKFTPKHAEQGHGWLSMGSDTTKSGGTAGKAHKRAIDLGEKTGSQPVGSSVVMGETSSRFNTNVAETMLRHLKENMPSKKSVAKFDAKMRETDPDWVGLNSESALSQLKGTDGFSMEGAGAHRKRFLQVLETKDFKDLGFPQPNTVLPLIDNPAHAGLPFGAQGTNFWLPDTARGIENVTGLHDTYSHSMPLLKGGTMGQYEVPISFKAQNPKIWRETEGMMTSPKVDEKTGKIIPPRPLTESERIVKAMDAGAGKKGTVQMMDQEAIDSANAAIRHNKGLVAKYGTLAAALAAGEVMADDTSNMMAETGLEQLREGQAKAQAKAGLRDYMKRPMSALGDVNPTREHAARGEIDRSSRMRQMYIDKLGPERGSEAFNAVQQVIEQVKKDAYYELQQKLYDTGSHPNQLNSHRAPASETMVDLGEALQSKYGMGMLDITGKAIERIGQGEKLSPVELGMAGLESATLPFTAGSAGYLKNAAKVGGFAGTGAGVDVGLTSGLSANTLRSILERMQEEEAMRGR